MMLRQKFGDDAVMGYYVANVTTILCDYKLWSM